MRYGVIADIHGNLAALETVLEALRRAGVDRIVCLGDLVGYGPQPDEVVDTIAGAGIATVAGNHDRVVAGVDPLDRAGEEARRTLEWTQQVVRDDTRAFLLSLPARIEVDDILAAHGSIDDPWHYVRRVPDALVQLHRIGSGRRLLCLGHTHRQMALDVSSGRIATSEGVLGRSRRAIPAPGPTFVNPGSVGQPRELRPLARFAVVDATSGLLELRALGYPHRRTEAALAARGLPASWCHPRPTLKKIVRQVGRDARDRRTPIRAAGERAT